MQRKACTLEQSFGCRPPDAPWHRFCMLPIMKPTSRFDVSLKTVLPAFRRHRAASCVSACLLAACSVRPFGASDANLEQAKSNAQRGATLFDAQCAQCHGERGEGRGNVPAIMGPGALKRYPQEDSLSQTTYAGSDGQRGSLRPPEPAQGRPEFVSAQNLQSYLAYHMPKIERAPMTDEDYWDVVQFMLIAHGSQVPAEGLSPSNGSKVAIQAR